MTGPAAVREARAWVAEHAARLRECGPWLVRHGRLIRAVVLLPRTGFPVVACPLSALAGPRAVAHPTVLGKALGLPEATARALVAAADGRAGPSPGAPG